MEGAQRAAEEAAVGSRHRLHTVADDHPGTALGEQREDEHHRGEDEKPSRRAAVDVEDSQPGTRPGAAVSN
ncbi:hypothetical protein [Streptomyces sp. NPDC055099]